MWDSGIGDENDKCHKYARNADMTINWDVFPYVFEDVNTDDDMECISKAEFAAAKFDDVFEKVGGLSSDSDCPGNISRADFDALALSKLLIEAPCWGSQGFSDYCAATEADKCSLNGTMGRGIFVCVYMCIWGKTVCRCICVCLGVCVCVREREFVLSTLYTYSHIRLKKCMHVCIGITGTSGEATWYNRNKATTGGPGPSSPCVRIHA